MLKVICTLIGTFIGAGFASGKEIYLFLDITKTPSLLSFTKSTKCNYSKFDYVIKEVCCEYCFMSMIDDFLMKRELLVLKVIMKFLSIKIFVFIFFKKIT